MIARLLPFVLLSLPGIARADERSIMVTGYDAVRVEGPFAVTVTTGGSARARIVGDARAVDTVDVRIEDRTLVVTLDASAWGGWPGETPARPVIEASTPVLRAITLTGGGRIAADRLEGQEVVVTLSGSGIIAVGDVVADQLRASVIGSGKVALAGEVNRARFTVNGPGSFDAADLRADDLGVVSESSSDSSFAAVYSADIQALGVGAVEVAGQPGCSVRGPGAVLCGTAE